MKTIFAATLAMSAALSNGTGFENLVRSPPPDAEFRWQAERMYSDLEKPSCEAGSGFNRQASLEPEREAVRSFEHSIKGTPAFLNSQLAKADAEYNLAKEQSCWLDSDPNVASRHVSMTNETVRNSLERMRALASFLHDVPAPNFTGGSARLRYLIRQLIGLSRPRCRLTTKADNDHVMAPARAEVARFRRGLNGTAYAAQFDVAVEDVAYEYSVVSVECDDPESTAPAAVARDALVRVKRQIAAIERQIRSRSPEVTLVPTKRHARP